MRSAVVTPSATRNPSAIVPAGNSLEVSVSWSGPSGLLAVPVEVRYQVFDFKTRYPVSAVTDVSDVAASMRFVVPGDDLPGDGSDRRRLLLKISATFEASEHSEYVDVYVARGIEFVG